MFQYNTKGLEKWFSIERKCDAYLSESRLRQGSPLSALLLNAEIGILAREWMNTKKVV